MTPFPCASGRRFDFSASFLLFVPCVLRRGLIQFPTPSLSHSLPPHNTRFFSFLSSHTRILFIPPHLALAYCLFLRTSRPHTVYSPAPRACILFIPPHLAPVYCLFTRTSRLHTVYSPAPRARILFIPPHLALAYCLFPRTSRPHSVYSPAPRARIKKYRFAVFL